MPGTEGDGFAHSGSLLPASWRPGSEFPRVPSQVLPRSFCFVLVFCRHSSSVTRSHLTAAPWRSEDASLVLPSPENPASAGFSLFGSLLVLGLLAGEAADRLTVVAVVGVGRIDVARVEVEAVGEASTRVRSRRPINTLDACVPQRPREDAPAGIEVIRSLGNSSAVKATN